MLHIGYAYRTNICTHIDTIVSWVHSVPNRSDQFALVRTAKDGAVNTAAGVDFHLEASQVVINDELFIVGEKATQSRGKTGEPQFECKGKQPPCPRHCLFPEQLQLALQSPLFQEKVVL